MELTQDDSIVWEAQPRHDERWRRRMEELGGMSPCNSTCSDEPTTVSTPSSATAAAAAAKAARAKRNSNGSSDDPAHLLLASSSSSSSTSNLGGIQRSLDGSFALEFSSHPQRSKRQGGKQRDGNGSRPAHKSSTSTTTLTSALAATAAATTAHEGRSQDSATPKDASEKTTPVATNKHGQNHVDDTRKHVHGGHDEFPDNTSTQQSTPNTTPQRKRHLDGSYVTSRQSRRSTGRAAASWWKRTGLADASIASAAPGAIHMTLEHQQRQQQEGDDVTGGAPASIFTLTSIDAHARHDSNGGDAGAQSAGKEAAASSSSINAAQPPPPSDDGDVFAHLADEIITTNSKDHQPKTTSIKQEEMTQQDMTRPDHDVDSTNEDTSSTSARPSRKSNDPSPVTSLRPSVTCQPSVPPLPSSTDSLANTTTSTTASTSAVTNANTNTSIQTNPNATPNAPTTLGDDASNPNFRARRATVDQSTGHTHTHSGSRMLMPKQEPLSMEEAIRNLPPAINPPSQRTIMQATLNQSQNQPLSSQSAVTGSPFSLRGGGGAMSPTPSQEELLLAALERNETRRCSSALINRELAEGRDGNHVHRTTTACNEKKANKVDGESSRAGTAPTNSGSAARRAQQPAAEPTKEAIRIKDEEGESKEEQDEFDDEFDEFDFGDADIVAIDNLVAASAQTVAQTKNKQAPSDQADGDKKRQRFQPPTPLVTSSSSTLAATDRSPIASAASIAHPNHARSDEGNREVAQVSTGTSNHRSAHNPPEINPSMTITSNTANNNNSNNKDPGGDDDDDEFGDDEFGDFPDIDFEAVDEQINTAMTQGDGQDAQNPIDLMEDQVTAANLPSQVHNVRQEHCFERSSEYPCFSRYKVVEVESDTQFFVKTLALAAWTDRMRQEEIEEKQIHRDARVKVVADAKGNGAHSDEKHGSGISSATTLAHAKCGKVFLRGEWYHTIVEAGDTVHICSLSGNYRTDPAALPIILDTHPADGSDIDDLVLVMHPDSLMTATIVSDTLGSSGCTRRAVVKSRLGSAGMTSSPALLGTMRHDFFGKCLMRPNLSFETARAIAHAIVRENAENIVGCGMTDREALSGVLDTLPQARSFMNMYMANGQADRPTDAYALLEGHNYQASVRVLINSIVSIEDPLISSELGLKGNMDVIVDANIKPEGHSTSSASDSLFAQPNESATTKKLMVLELKTGYNQNTQLSHMAQLGLYTLMLQSRHGVGDDSDVSSPRHGSTASKASHASNGGFLLYLNHKGIKSAHASPHLNQVMSLIGQRNVVASELKRASRPKGLKLSYEMEEGEHDFHKCVSVTPEETAVLPAVLATPNTCTRCYANRECMMFAASAMDAEASHGHAGSVAQTHGELLSKLTGHLSPNDFRYFRKWNRLIDLEHDATAASPATSWLLDAQRREHETDECISNLRFEGGKPTNRARTSFSIIFKRQRPSGTEGDKANTISKGSCVIVSTDSTIFDETIHVLDVDARGGKNDSPTRHVGNQRTRRKTNFRRMLFVVRGIVSECSKDKILVNGSKEDLTRLRNLVAGFKKSTDADADAHAAHGQKLPPPSFQPSHLPFRLDKDNASTGLGTLRQNLINFFTIDVVEGDDLKIRQLRFQKLRKLVVDLVPPAFREVDAGTLFSASRSVGVVPGCDFESLLFEFTELNRDQTAAVNKVVAAQDYALIQGFPGTGKTSALTFITRLLVARGLRVLVTSYTHNAVDNVALKLINDGLMEPCASTGVPPLVRVGKESACHEDVRPVLARELAAKLESNDPVNANADKHPPSASMLQKVISAARVVCCTALSVPKSALLRGQSFDVVIVDEAGQISQPAILGALMMADSFVLVGDHLQLPPLVVSDVAEQLGYGESLMSTLADIHPSSVVPLTLQYRMAKDICKLSSDAVYAGKMKCGTPAIANRRLELQHYPHALQAFTTPGSGSWLREVLDPVHNVMFLDTDLITTRMAAGGKGNKSFGFCGLEGRTSGYGGGTTNEAEHIIVRSVLRGLMACGLPKSKIGVMSPFRAQLELLRSLPETKKWIEDGLEFSTIDRYQGRDKDAILISFVRSNTSGNAGRLLQDIRRLNVALTRAKSKLILIGSFSTLTQGSVPLNSILCGIDGRNQRLVLRPIAPTEASTADANVSMEFE